MGRLLSFRALFCFFGWFFFGVPWCWPWGVSLRVLFGGFWVGCPWRSLLFFCGALSASSFHCLGSGVACSSAVVRSARSKDDEGGVMDLVVLIRGCASMLTLPPRSGSAVPTRAVPASITKAPEIVIDGSISFYLFPPFPPSPLGFRSLLASGLADADLSPSGVPLPFAQARRCFVFHSALRRSILVALTHWKI